MLFLSEEKKDQSEVPAPTGIMQFENGTSIKNQLDKPGLPNKEIVSGYPIGIDR